MQVANTWDDAEVSILVVMESAQEVPSYYLFSVLTIVSILVVMESAQEESFASLKIRHIRSFNPCCNGKCSGSSQARY